MKKLPASWQMIAFGEIVEQSQYGLSSSSSPDGRIPILGMKNINDGKLVCDDVARVNVSEEELKNYRLETGDLLFNRTNSPDLVGKTALFSETGDFVCASYLVRFTLRRDLVDPRFVCYWFNTDHSQRTLQQLATKAVAQANINPTALQKMFRLPLPSKAEQIEIADRLACWDEAISGVKSILAAKTEQKRGLMQQLLTGQTRFKEFKAEKWRHCHLGDVVQAMSRPVAWDENELYRLAIVRRWCGGVDLRESLYGHQIKVKKLQTIRTGDFLISHIQAAYGAMALVPEEFDGAKVSELYTILRPKDPKAFDIRILGYLGQTKRMWYMAIQASNGFFAERLRLNFDPDEFLHLPVNIPPTFAEQKKIADTLEACDREIVLLEKQLAALKEQKRGLMQKLLTGEIRVKVK